MNNRLVCYFSATGTTKEVAKKVSEILDCDIFEIEPVEKYTEKDLNWNDKNSRTTLEMEDNSFRPQIKERVKDLEKYNKIILLFPVWWYKNPSIINTFLDENNLEGKEIYVIVTSGGSSASSSLENLKNNYSNLNFVDGIKINYVTDPKEILDFVK